MYNVIINNDLTANVGITEVPFQFIYDSSTGKYGYKDGADTFRPFNDGSGGSIDFFPTTYSGNSSTYSSTYVAKTVDFAGYEQDSICLIYHYKYGNQRGFKLTVNGETISLHRTSLLLADNAWGIVAAFVLSANTPFTITMTADTWTQGTAKFYICQMY